MCSGINTGHLVGTYLPEEQLQELASLARNLTSGLHLVEPSCRHCGRIYKSSAFFPGICADGSPLGKRKTPWKWNIFTPSLLPLTLTYPVYCVTNSCTDVYTCFCSRVHTEKSVSQAPFFCAHQQQIHTSGTTSAQLPRRQGAASQVGLIVPCHFLLCGIRHYKH